MADYAAYTDQELLSLIRAGDHVAFNEVHKRLFKVLFKAAHNVLKDEDACMDIVQEVFVWFWEHRDRHSMNSIKGYLLMAIKYQVANYIRSGKVRASFFERMAALKLSESFEDDTLEVKELKAIIEKFTGQLPDRCAEVFRLSRQEHLTNKEIASRMGISEKTVEVQITTALKRLRAHLGNASSWFFFLM
ncbi:RNA polymerase sigma-70 factor [Pedobacter ginsengisoli]|uniref:RNA polymerase sigma-70 factor n=1 Tax=Pedobacter ginsengisoli TaxID=363852 RepID=UPI0025505AB1|nr:RNA polymerase sigma-70 factor [Pedobacter ginsengisoli]